MSLRRRVALAGGVVAAGAGLLAALRPGLVAGLSLGQSGILVVGALALLYALLPLALQRGSHRRQAPSPEPESVPTGDPPGDDLERLFAAASRDTIHNVDRRNELRRRIEAAAIRAVRKRDDCSVAAAREAVESGTWTDDPVAATYLADPDGDVAHELPVGRRIRFHLAGSSPEVRAARRAADVIAAITEPEDRP